MGSSEPGLKCIGRLHNLSLLISKMGTIAVTISCDGAEDEMRQ